MKSHFFFIINSKAGRRMQEDIKPPASEIPPRRPKSFMGVKGAIISKDRQIIRIRLVQIIGLSLWASVKLIADRMSLFSLFDL